MAEGFSVTSPSTIKMPRYLLSHSLLVRVVHISYMYDLLCGTHSCDAGLVPIASMYPHLALNFNRAWKVWRLHILFNCAHLSWQKVEVWKISGAPEIFQTSTFCHCHQVKTQGWPKSQIYKNVFIGILLKEDVCIFVQISMKVVFKDLINNNFAWLFKIMARC